MAGQSASSVPKFYKGVVDDVINNIREFFLDDGVDEQIIQDLRNTWERKIAESHATDHPVQAPIVPASSNSSTSKSSSTGSKKSSSSNSGPSQTSVITSNPNHVKNGKPTSASSISSILSTNSSSINNQANMARSSAIVPNTGAPMIQVLNNNQNQQSGRLVLNSQNMSGNHPSITSSSIVTSGVVPISNPLSQQQTSGRTQPAQSNKRKRLSPNLSQQQQQQSNGNASLNSLAEAASVVSQQSHNITPAQFSHLNFAGQPQLNLIGANSASATNLTQQNLMAPHSLMSNIIQLNSGGMNVVGGLNKDIKFNQLVPGQNMVLMNNQQQYLMAPNVVFSPNMINRLNFQQNANILSGLQPTILQNTPGLNAGTIQYASRGVNPQVVVKMEPGVQSSNAQPGTSNPTVVQRLSQLDGNGDFSDEEEDEDDYRYNDDDQDDNEDDLNDEENDGNCEDEEPLNSEDDVSDEDPNELFETENVVVCQYDKITRSRNKWKFHFKDGIMHLKGKDYVFLKAVGDAEW